MYVFFTLEGKNVFSEKRKYAVVCSPFPQFALKIELFFSKIVSFSSSK